ncbi:MAG: hypothetical protein ACI9YH_002597 [Colwellia sp.]|jgi:hypothetical protein
MQLKSGIARKKGGNKNLDINSVQNYYLILN